MSRPRSTLLIRDYDNIRRILRDIYIFGCFSRDDFVEMGISGRKYDNEQRRINAYLPQGFLRRRRENKKVQYYCYYGLGARYDHNQAENYLAETYGNKSFTLLDITSYFWILGILNDCPGITMTDLLKEIPQVNDDIIYTRENLRIKLTELEEKGFLYSTKSGRTVRYYLAEDILGEFTRKELYDICRFLDFVQNIIPLEMPYMLLKRKLILYLFSKEAGRDGFISGEVAEWQNKDRPSHRMHNNCANKYINIAAEYSAWRTGIPTGAFQFKHNHLFNILDNEIMLDLLGAISGQRIVLLKRTGAEEKIQAVPVRIIHECTYGRQYLLCMEYGKERAAMIRLDRIDAITAGEAVSAALLEKALVMAKEEEECWCTSGLGEEVHKVVIEVQAGEGEKYIIKRLEKEGHGGSITEIGNGIYHYEIGVRDPGEMIPWIRSFGEHMKVISDDGSMLIERVAEDWERALSKYETV